MGLLRKRCSSVGLFAALVALLLMAGSIGPVAAYAEESSGEASGSAQSQGTVSGADPDGNLVDPTQQADNSFIYDTTIESMFDEASLYDGRTVQVVGEAIGDLIQANDAERNCWVMLTSTDTENPASVSILISADQAAQIDHFGRYGVTGTMLQVRGEFHQTCAEHDGLPDIHVTNSAVMARGVEHPDDLNLGDFVWGIAALAIGGLLLGLYYVARERAR